MNVFFQFSRVSVLKKILEPAFHNILGYQINTYRQARRN